MKKIKTLEIKDERVPVAHTSTKYSVGWRDTLIGLLMAIGTPILTYLYDLTMAWANYQDAHFDLRIAVKYGLSAAAIYIGKNFFQSSRVIIKQNDLPA